MGGLIRSAALLALALPPGAAGAHPLNEVAQTAYLTLAPGRVELMLDIAAGLEAAPAVLAALDPDADGRVTDAEAAAYADLVLGQSILTLDGADTAWRLERIVAPAAWEVAAGAGVIAIHASAERPDAAAAHTLDYVNDYAPAAGPRAANVFLSAGGGWSYEVLAQRRGEGGARLSVGYAVTRAPGS